MREVKREEEKIERNRVYKYTVNANTTTPAALN